MKKAVPFHFKSATALARDLRSRKISALEILDQCWHRVEAHNPVVNAIIFTDIERARSAARAADQRLQAGRPLGPLDGVPVTIKESFDWSGTPSTWGVPAYRNNIAQTDALAVRRLEEAGAVIFGKTNVPLMLADWQSYNDIHGTTNNPWDLSRSPGGSSGGSAAALATGMSALEIGSDIGASIRNPAHYCGVYGHKPTFGIVPMRGHALPGVHAASDISVAGPLARSAADLELSLKILAGPDSSDAEAAAYRLKRPRTRRWEELRVAVQLTDPASEVDAAVQAQIERLTSFLSPKVRSLSTTARPAFTSEEAWSVYIGLLRSATSRRQSDEEFASNAAKAAALRPDDRSYLALMLRAYTMSHRDWLHLNNRRHAMIAAWTEFFRDYDVLLCPAAASAAFPHDQKGERYDRTIIVNGKAVSTMDQLFWAGYPGGYYLPATVAPIGLTDEGLPVGVQIVAGRHEDLTSIAVAALIERDYWSFRPPPDFA